MITSTGQASAASSTFKPLSIGAPPRIRQVSEVTSKTSGKISSQALQTIHPGSIQTLVKAKFSTAGAASPVAAAPEAAAANSAANSGFVGNFNLGPRPGTVSAIKFLGTTPYSFSAIFAASLS